jgi:hypothetical protein
MAKPARLPSPYPEGTTVETVWLDAQGQPTAQDEATGGETVVTLPDGSIEWLAFNVERR